MTRHDLWHIAVLGSTLFGGAGLLIILLRPLILDDRLRPEGGVLRVVVGLVALAAALLLLEWLVVH